MPLFGAAGEYGVITIISCLAWGLGYFGMPQVLVRFMSVSHSKEIRKSRIIATIWVVVSLSSAVCIGLIGRAVLPDTFLTQASAENIFIVLSQMLLPAFFCGLVVSGIFAASMSSSSSYLLISGSAVAENIFGGLIKKDATDAQVMIVARVTLVVVLLFGIAIALDETSSNLYSCFVCVGWVWCICLVPFMLMSLYWRRTNFQGAVAGMIVGAATVLIWNTFVKPLGGVFGIYELLPAFILSLLAIVVVSLLTKAPDKEITDEFDRYMQEDC